MNVATMLGMVVYAGAAVKMRSAPSGSSDEEEEEVEDDNVDGDQPVSYTHLTLPTIYSV